MLTTLKAGTVIDARYEIVEHLGDGGMGSVFKARELGLERLVAVKMLHPSLIGDKEHRERFKREGAVLSKLEHPHLLQCFRFGVWNGMFPYIAMEYIHGNSLSSLIAENGRLDPARLIALGKQICSAMEHAHQHKIVHRDLKSANIMVLKDASGKDSVKVLDFGLAKVVQDSGRASQHLTNTGDLIGSVYYMSPEQCLGKPCDAISDVYSLGCLLYEALTGAPPLMADTPVGLMYLHANTCPELLSKKLPQVDLPAGLDAVIARSLEKDPARRFQSMKQFESDLDLVAAGRGTEVAISAPGQSQESSKRRLVALLSVTGVVGLVGLGLAVAFKPTASVVEPIFVNNRSKDSGRVVLRHLDPIEFYYKPSMDRVERISKIKEWLSKYGSYDLQGRIAALAMLSNIHFDGRTEEDRKQASNYARQLTDGLALLLRDETAIRGARTRGMETTMGLVRGVLCNEQGSLLGMRTFLRDYEKLSSDALKDSVNKSMADIFSAAGLYDEEMSLRRKVLHPGLQDQIQYGFCLYRQGKFSEAREAVGTFSREAYAFYSEDPWHQIPQTLLEMGLVPEATTYLDFCLPRKIGSSDVMMQALGQRLVCANPRTHARTEALILNLRKEYRGASRCLVNALAGAPPKELQRYRQDLLPLAVRNAEQGHLDLSTLLDGAMNQASIGDIGWMLAVASTCRKTNPSLADRLFARCIQIVEVNRRKSPSDTQWTTLVAAALNEVGRPTAAREFLLTVLPNAHDEGDALWMHIVLAKSLLDLNQLDDSEHQLSMVRPEVCSEVTKDEVDRLVLHLRARIARARGRLPESCKLFEQLRVTIRNSPTIGIEEKIEILEDYAKTCRLMKQMASARDLEKESQVLLPDECRGPWRTWRPLIVERRPISIAP